MKTAYEAKQAKDMDLFVNMVNNDQAHIARAKAKALKAHARRRAPKKKAKTNLGPAACAVLAFLGLFAFSLSFFL